MKEVKKEKKCPCEQCVHGTYMIVEKEWWCDKHLKYASQMERNRRCEKFETISGGDAVSRQAVLDIVKFEENWLSDAKSNNADTDIAFGGIRTQVAKLSSVTKALEPCEDCISREAVLDMATTIQTDDCSGNEAMEVVDVDDIKTLPPVTPTRKKGKWIFSGNYDEVGMLYCSNCKHEIDVSEGYFKWCPNCGAKMEK